MMENESVNDIIAEVRAYGAQPPPRLMWLEIADRLESAWKRERQPLTIAEWIDKTETVADIAAVLRRYVLPSLAERLEAAWKRERAEIEDIAKSKMLDGATIVDNRSVGNAGALRKALIEIVDRAIEVIDDDEGTCRKIVELAQAALAEPARNCDVHTGWLTALKKFNDTDGKRKPWGDDVFDTRFLDWLFAFMTEKGANDGR